MIDIKKGKSCCGGESKFADCMVCCKPLIDQRAGLREGQSGLCIQPLLCAASSGMSIDDRSHKKD